MMVRAAAAANRMAAIAVAYPASSPVMSILSESLVAARGNPRAAPPPLRPSRKAFEKRLFRRRACRCCCTSERFLAEVAEFSARWWDDTSASLDRGLSHEDNRLHHDLAA